MSAVPETFSQSIVRNKRTVNAHPLVSMTVTGHRTSDQVTFTKMWRMQSVRCSKMSLAEYSCLPVHIVPYTATSMVK